MGKYHNYFPRFEERDHALRFEFGFGKGKKTSKRAQTQRDSSSFGVSRQKYKLSPIIHLCGFEEVSFSRILREKIFPN